jgi:hypothetical protein
MSKCTQIQRKGYRRSPEPWQSWTSTLRYLMVKLAQTGVVLIWLTYVRH